MTFATPHPDWQITISCFHVTQFPTDGDGCGKNVTVSESRLSYNNVKLSGGKEVSAFFITCPRCGKVLVVPFERIPTDVMVYVMTATTTNGYLNRNTKTQLAMLQERRQQLGEEIVAIDQEIATLLSQCRHEHISPYQPVCLDCGKHFG